MSTFPSSISRVPNLLISRMTGGSLTRTSLAIARLQERLSTGLAVNRPSDDSVKAAAISLLNERLERGSQIVRNLQHADSALLELDTALGEATDLLNEAHQIALSQIDAGAGPEERKSQAIIIQSMIDSLHSIANREGVAGHLFGGRTPGVAPLEAFLGGYRYRAGSQGLFTDLGEGNGVPITLGGSALGSTSSRHIGLIDLDPNLTGDTRISDLRGARGLGVELGVVRFTFGSGESREVDLTGADTVQDTLDSIESAIRAYENDAGIDVLGPGGVSISGKRIVFDVVADAADGSEIDLVFTDVGAGSTASDLGLNDEGGLMGFNRSGGNGLGLDPKLTMTTPIGSLSALRGPLGEIRLRAAGSNRVIDLSQATTVQDLRELVQGAGLGLRVKIDPDGDRIVIVNEVAGSRDMAMAIEEVSGGLSTAAALGIKTLDFSTPVSLFNDGRGVEVLTGGVDEVTGQPDPARDVDFAITLGNGFEISINLAPQDLATVGDMLAAINTQADQQLSAANLNPSLFRAGVGEGPNGIAFTQDTSDPSITGGIQVRAKNNSTASWQLGLLNATYDQNSGTLLGEDRTRIRVSNSFSDLLDLRNSLDADDTLGIQFATENLENSLSQTIETRALVGGFNKQVLRAAQHQEERTVLDEIIKSQLQDLDFVAAASRFTLLQTQLQAGLQSAAALNRLSLLDFLG